MAVAAFEAGALDANLGGTEQSVRMEVAFVLGPKSRLSDVDNRLKALQDALQLVGVLSNDRHIRIFEAARVNGLEDRTLVKLFVSPAPTLEQVMAWWDLPDPHMEQVIGGPR